jgi:hypothetical protein
MTDPLPDLVLVDPADFPPLYRSANRTSLAAQARFFRAMRVRITALLIATVAGALGVSIAGVAATGIIAFLSFVVALVAELYLAIAKPDRAWYEGRAAAESAKTLTWRFAVRSESFERVTDAEATKRLTQDLREVLTDLRDIDVDPSDQGNQVTAPIQEARRAAFADRRKLYRESRIVDQQNWYSGKAAWNRRRAARWFGVGIVAEGAGIVAGALVAFDIVHFDLLGILGAVGVAASAWSQARQHSNLATAYSVTALELGSVLDELDALRDESDWSKFVGESEEAISREHTLWRASRGIRIRTRRSRA